MVKAMERQAPEGQVCFNRIQKIVKHMAIRRLKTDKVKGQPLVVLPQRNVNITYIKFSEDERKVCRLCAYYGIDS